MINLRLEKIPIHVEFSSKINVENRSIFGKVTYKSPVSCVFWLSVYDMIGNWTSAESIVDT